MATLVSLFFIGSTASLLVTGFALSRGRLESLRYFGLGLMMDGIAFGIWTVAVVTKPDEGLGGWVTAGVLFFLASLILFVLTSAGRIAPRQRPILVGATIVYVVAVFMVRVFYPSRPHFSEEGLFFFDPHGAVEALEILGLTAALLPATFEVSRRMRMREGYVAKAAFTTLLIGGILLIASDDRILLTIDGWAMGLALIVLLITFGFRRPEAWLAEGAGGQVPPDTDSGV